MKVEDKLLEELESGEIEVEELKVLKVKFHDGFYVLIVPDGKYTRNLYLCHDVIGAADHMLHCKVVNDEGAIRLAKNHAEEYIERWRVK